MTDAGRGYCIEEDIQKTVELWKTLPICCTIACDKFLRQMLEDSLMQPLRKYLDENFKEPKRVYRGDDVDCLVVSRAIV